MPRTKTNLRPAVIDFDKYHKVMDCSRNNYKNYYDKKTSPRNNLEGLIYYQEKPNSFWKKGKVIKEYPDRSYQIETEEGRVIRRNKLYLKKRGEELELLKEDDLFEEDENSERIDRSFPETTPVNNSNNGSYSLQQKTNSLLTTRQGRVINKPTRYLD